jgi:MinD superfamily P-loop ATPase
MKIAITGGKGGTGKSTIATALAVELARKYKTMIADADVDCPNDHLILNIRRKKIRDIFQPIPKINRGKCQKCGRCAEVCKEHAIVFVDDKYPVLIPEQCIGCSACMIACPHNAVEKDERKIGTIYQGNFQNLKFFSAETEIGVEEESPIVNALKNEVEKQKKKFDYIVFDTSPGTHCNVISALQGSDLAICVAEPTPLGAHDLKLILELLKILKIPAKILLNKSDIGNKKLIEKITKDFQTAIIGEIPYSKKIMESYSKGKIIEDSAITKLKEHLERKKK